MLNRTVCIAPMMGYTDRHARYFLRLISRHVLLYTEMVTTGAVMHGDRKKLLRYDSRELPLAIQLGGSDPHELADCSRMAEDAGFSEVNLNVGCPSDRVQNHLIGACLMAYPQRVAEAVAAMRSVVALPVTVKCRIGIDQMESYADFERFVETVASAGCDTFIVHARKAWLQGLSPKQNREIPPLKYDFVYRLKRQHPHLTIVINGGIKTIEQMAAHLKHVDGVMLGREAYHNPYLLAQVDRRFNGDTVNPWSRDEILEAFINYAKEQLAAGESLHRISRHLHGLYKNVHGAKAWKRYLSEHAHKPGAGIQVLQQARQLVL
ncbi:MAG: tRNA dihydrouridine(20/20a) synthase DusA [Gammaproteobacteria bacterium]|nr:tRNA dihydrouridine(20/20a) synthase DusA [Gammaproteobacteria bacterium]NNJ97589.1 tRNA dihydrouridine(20/20a) synthase DusA [Gammaproteobacteria bacterium]